MKIVKNKLGRKLGNLSLALIFCLTDRGIIAIEEILDGRKSTLGKSLRRINNLPTIHDYYSDLVNAKKDSLRKTIRRLQERGLVAKNAQGCVLTSLGAEFSRSITEQAQNFNDKDWDGKWRIVFFDIPESKRRDRRWINFELKNIGYRQLQKSVLAGKRPIGQDFYTELSAKGLRDNIRIMTVGEIDYDFSDYD
ncbi:MAG: hypothetical protein AAB345_03695 [Patescibacteria group bacterium]